MRPGDVVMACKEAGFRAHVVVGEVVAVHPKNRVRLRATVNASTGKWVLRTEAPRPLISLYVHPVRSASDLICYLQVAYGSTAPVPLPESAS